MSRKNTVIVLMVIVVFLVLAGGVASVYFRKPPSPVAALVADDARIAVFLDAELFAHPASRLLIGAVTQSPDLTASLFSGAPGSRGLVFWNDAEWVLLSETELIASSLMHETVVGVHVYAEKEEGMQTIKDRVREDDGEAASRRSFVRLDASDLTGAPTIAVTETISAELSLDGAALLATLATPIDTLIPDVSFSSFIPPRGSAAIPVTAPLDGENASLLGAVLASFGARPQRIAIIALSSDRRTAFVWREHAELAPAFAEEKVRQLAETLADRFPKVVVRTLPDGSIAELLTRDAKQFEPTVLDGGVAATLRAGSDTIALSSVQRSHDSWVIVGNNLDLVRGVRDSVGRGVPTDDCSEIPNRSRMVFHLDSGLVGAIDANGNRVVVCLSS